MHVEGKGKKENGRASERTSERKDREAKQEVRSTCWMRVHTSINIYIPHTLSSVVHTTAYMCRYRFLSLFFCARSLLLLFFLLCFFLFLPYLEVSQLLSGSESSILKHIRKEEREKQRKKVDGDGDIEEEKRKSPLPLVCNVLKQEAEGEVIWTVPCLSCIVQLYSIHFLSLSRFRTWPLSMPIWSIWKPYRPCVNRIFVICAKQFVMKLTMLIMFYSGLLLSSTITHLFILPSFLDVCFPFILLHTGWQHSS